MRYLYCFFFIISIITSCSSNLQNGNDIISNETPIFTLIAEGDLNKIQDTIGLDSILINNSINNGITPLHWAIIKGKKDIVLELLNNGATIEAIYNDNTYNNCTPLYTAIISKQIDIARILIENGANVNHILTLSNMGLESGNILMVASSVLNDKNVSFIKYLIDNGSDLTYSDAQGMNALHTSAMAGNVEIGKLLIDNGIKINSQFESGWTALCLVSNNGHIKYVKMLLENNADQTIGPLEKMSFINGIMVEEHSTPLELAKESGYKSIVRLLSN